jgi:enoyl-CoA hydratase
MTSASIPLATILSRAADGESAILVEQDEDANVSVVTLNRPVSHNSITLAMWQELASIIERLGKTSTVIVLRGGGDSAFSVGADITEFPRVRMTEFAALGYSTAIAGAIDALRRSPAPVVAMMRGLAVGGGCELAAAADLRIAARGTRLGIPIGRLGVTLGLSEAAALVDLLGLARAKAFVLGGRLIDMEEALRIGLVDIACDPEDLAGETTELVLRLARSAWQTTRSTKRVLVAAASGSTTEHEKAFATELVSVYEGGDLREGVAAFLQRREPRFATNGARG